MAEEDEGQAQDNGSLPDATGADTPIATELPPAEGAVGSLEAEAAAPKGAGVPAVEAPPKSFEELTEDERDAHPWVKDRLARESESTRQRTQATERAQQQALALEYADNAQWQDDAAKLFKEASDEGELTEEKLTGFVARVRQSSSVQLSTALMDRLDAKLEQEGVTITAEESNARRRVRTVGAYLDHSLDLIVRHRADKLVAASNAKAVAEARTADRARAAQEARNGSGGPTGVKGGVSGSSTSYSTQVEAESLFVRGLIDSAAVLAAREMLPYS